MVLSFKPRTEGGLQMVARLKAGFDQKGIDRIVEVVALRSLARLVAATPKKWTGDLRRQWQMERIRPGVRYLVNRSKVMRFIEHGTANEGTGYIYPKRKKVLYIPLTRAAAIGGWHPGLMRGTDYVLARRVRGIKPRHIAQKEQRTVTAELYQAVRLRLISLIDKVPGATGRIPAERARLTPEQLGAAVDRIQAARLKGGRG